MKKTYISLSCLLALGIAAWISIAGQNGRPQANTWTEVAPGVYRSPGSPAGYALVDGADALLIDAPHDGAGLADLGVKKIAGVYLTHYHRASCAAVDFFLAQKIGVHAPSTAKEWLSVEGVKEYWKESIPLRGSRTAYQVVPAGFEGIQYDVKDGEKITWKGWELDVIDTRGHALAHVSFLARKGIKGPTIAFVGGAFASPGKLWAPYTTDWDHWTDAGLTPAVKSLYALAERKPDILCHAHGPVLSKNAVAALEQTAQAIEEVAFLKSFERFTKKRLGNAPTYNFLAIEQKESNGSKPWSRVSEHLYITGNTYVLVSKDNACLMMDPWDKRSADQFAKLQKDKNLGPLEVVTFSHAHFDHYDGIYHLPDRDKLQVWTLDLVAPPLVEPFRLRAPFLDARPVRFERTPKDGDSLTWREYRFTFHHLPGQTEFTMGVEATIDGKKCYFTADNFFHQDMFSGSGGWMGLNRSFRPLYAASAQKVLDACPDWVLAEHGGPFEFNAEDFKRRVDWGKAAAQAADAICPSGLHRLDWDPHHVHVEPLVQKAKPGDKLKMKLVVNNPQTRAWIATISLPGRGLTADHSWKREVTAGKTLEEEFTLTIGPNAPAGRQVLPLRVISGDVLDGSDAFVVVEVER